MAMKSTSVPAEAVTSAKSDKQFEADADWRLHKHADYQRVYKNSRKQFSVRIAYFVAPQAAELIAMRAGNGARVGITAGRVLGKAVDRNRIKRRMRAAICAHFSLLPAGLDIVLHPKRSVLEAPWAELDGEMKRVFTQIRKAATQKSALKKNADDPPSRVISDIASAPEQPI